MKIPEELKGKEVGKFENEMLCAIAPKVQDFNFRLRKFYTQSFTPSMIERYFEGLIKNNLGGYKVNYISFYLIEDLFGNIIQIEQNAIPEAINIYSRLYTLSDFVNACDNNDIKLKWRSE